MEKELIELQYMEGMSVVEPLPFTEEDLEDAEIIGQFPNEEEDMIPYDRIARIRCGDYPTNDVFNELAERLLILIKQWSCTPVLRPYWASGYLCLRGAYV